MPALAPRRDVNIMIETIFSFDERNYRTCQRTFRGPRNQEYYLGDYAIEGRPQVSVRADRKAVGACSIIRLRSNTRMSFRRGWAHIREDGADVAVLWFVKRGRLDLTHQGGRSSAMAGHFLFTQSKLPFAMECALDSASVHEVLHLVVPSHVLRQVMPTPVKTGFCLPTGNTPLAIAEHIFTDVFEATADFPERMAQLLIESALQVLGSALESAGAGIPTPRTVVEQRVCDILRFIEIHISDPALSAAAVAQACGISPRYLSQLLQSSGTPYSSLVWGKRLQIARQLILQPEELPIAGIAHRAGFKSPAHFSRTFKRAFKLCPVDFRLKMRD
jgi:AraC-like DNA-binding protein